MRLLVATEQWFPDYIGGTARVVRATATALVERGHDVTVVAPRHLNHGAVSTEEGVEVHRVLPRNRIPNSWADSLRWRRLSRAYALNADVALAHHPTCAAALTFPTVRLPTVYAFHASPYREARHRRRQGVPTADRVRSLAVEPALSLAEAVSAARADSIVVLSEFSKTLVATDHPRAAGRVRVVGGGVDVDLYKPSLDRERLRLALGIAPEEILILTVRRLVPRMGIDLLIGAVARLRGSGLNCKLRIVGNGELRGKLEALIGGLGLGDQAKVLGEVSEEEVRRLYQAADIFVLPSTAYEGFGMATVEALASGTPVVGTAEGATPEILAPLDSALIAMETSAEGLEIAMRGLLERADANLRGRCRNYAVETYSWHAVSSRWEAALAAAY
jgi:glycosyltransferase involved in cell wall biosynthesis